MSGLILKLRPNEEFMINGVVVQNGDRKTRLRIKTSGAAILRMKDAIRPDEADTPEKKAYYIAQLAVSGELDHREAAAILGEALSALSVSYDGRAEKPAIDQARAELNEGRIYNVMRRLGETFLPPEKPEERARAG